MHRAVNKLLGLVAKYEFYTPIHVNFMLASLQRRYIYKINNNSLSDVYPTVVMEWIFLLDTYSHVSNACVQQG